MPLFPPVMRAFLPASFMISSWTAGPLTTTTVINGIWRVPNFASSKQESWEDRSSPVAVAEIWPSVVSDQAAKFAVLGSQGPEAGANLFGEELRLFPGRKVAALGQLVVMDQFGIRPLRPTARAQIDLVRKGAYGNRDGDAFDIEIPEFAEILPIEAGSGNRRVRQPGDRDVVEDVVARETFGFSLKDARDQRVAPS